MDTDTGLVVVQIIQKGARCIWLKGQRTPASKFYMHVRCTAGVLFKLMESFNYANNGMQPTKGRVEEYPKIVED
jgi:hypothetical protein